MFAAFLIKHITQPLVLKFYFPYLVSHLYTYSGIYNICTYITIYFIFVPTYFIYLSFFFHFPGESPQTLRWHICSVWCPRERFPTNLLCCWQTRQGKSMLVIHYISRIYFYISIISSKLFYNSPMYNLKPHLHISLIYTVSDPTCQHSLRPHLSILFQTSLASTFS